MNELEYAKMLEIPVSTVNVVKKQRRGAKRPASTELKNKVIDQINEKLSGAEIPSTAPITEAEVAPALATETVDERLDTVLVYPNKRARKRALAEWFSSSKEPTYAPQENDPFAIQEEVTPNELPAEESEFVDAQTLRKEKRAKRILGAEFAAACALVCGIFLTNALMPTSAINTFFAGLFPAEKEQDTRVYTDFNLDKVVGDYTDAEFTLSNGVLTFTQKCCVYPAVDGTVSSVAQAEDGSYTVTIAHSDAFSGVIANLDYVYYAVGDEVYSNVPIGFSNGEKAVEVSMFWEGEPLNCYELDEQNCLTWIEQEQDA
ncbi:MAG: hypothetical protein IJV80_06620 [Clostridia bacterium]|nr:hypothetical protein [Clostridia bacterium]